MKAFLILTLMMVKAWAHDFPASYRYQILTTDKTSSTVTRNSFLSIPSLILLTHQSHIQKEKVNVIINTDWEKPYFTAWAHHEGGNKFSLNFWGGLARIPGMNDEGFALTACHELGHVIGGTPKIKIKEFLWSSAEGQSDYFASGVCLKNYFTLLHKMNKLTTPDDIPGTSYTLCRTTYSNETDFLICLNISKAIEGFKNMLQHLQWYEETYDIETPSRRVVASTMYDSYPDPQCRIDTLFQGSLCPLNEFPCTGKRLGARPQCWFK